MKKILFASAALAAALAAAPAFAGSGFVDLGYSDTDSGNVKSWNIGGSAVASVGSDWNVQGDVRVHRLDVGGNINYTDAGLHAFMRNDQHALGVYANSTDFFGVSAFGFGVEGAYYMDQVTLSGSLGWDTMDGGFFGPGSSDGWDATLGAKFFVNDNFSIGADYGHVDFDGFTTDNYGINAEFKPETAPVSFFGGWRHNSDGGFFTSGDYSTWSLGVRWNFGGGSLKSRDRTGASMTSGNAFSRAIL
jgi:hypothetical protein